MPEPKGTIRDRMRSTRTQWTDDQRRDWSDAIVDRVCRHAEWGQAHTVGGYLSMAGEVMTQSLLNRCWSEGRTVCVPALREDGATYAFRTFTPETPVETRAFGVPEPSTGDWVDPLCLDVVIVPGLAFTTKGDRLGHGGGHYDRLLSAASPAGSRPIAMGVCFESQIVSALPTEPHDQRMNWIVTEKQTIQCK